MQKLTLAKYPNKPLVHKMCRQTSKELAFYFK